FRFFRTALFLPQLIAGVVIAQAWTWIYDDNGPLNWALREVGLGSLARPWLGDFSWALPAIGTIGTWVTYGLCMVLFVSGVQKIPSTLYDAARVDGAGAVREFLAVTLPGLRGEVLVARVLTLFSLLAIYPILSILFLALHKKTDLVTGFAFPTHLDLSSFKAAWTEGRFGTGFLSSFIVAATVTVVSAVLSIGTGYAFGT